MVLGIIVLNVLSKKVHHEIGDANDDMTIVAKQIIGVSISCQGTVLMAQPFKLR